MGDHLTAPPLSPARGRALIKYVERLRDTLLLSHWTIILLEEHPQNGDAWASIEPMTGRYLAKLRIGEGLFEEPPEKVRLVLVHEMFHVARAKSLVTVLEGEFRAELGQTLYDQFAGAYKREMEYEIDLTAEALARFFPLPPKWPR